MRKWRIEDSAELYNINGWGLKYFSINDKGHVAVTRSEERRVGKECRSRWSPYH